MLKLLGNSNFSSAFDYGMVRKVRKTPRFIVMVVCQVSEVIETFEVPWGMLTFGSCNSLVGIDISFGVWYRGIANVKDFVE